MIQHLSQDSEQILVALGKNLEEGQIRTWEQLFHTEAAGAYSET